jgi:hypothetical protein
MGTHRAGRVAGRSAILALLKQQLARFYSIPKKVLIAHSLSVAYRGAATDQLCKVKDGVEHVPG